MIIVLVLTIIVLYVIYTWLNWRPKNFPPGPVCLPFVGTLLSTPWKNFQNVMAKDWQNKYGPVVGLMFGSYPAIAVCGPKEVLEVLKKEECQGRPNNAFFKKRSFKKRLGVIFTDGPYWVEQRRFTLRHLRDFGYGKKDMEVLITEELEQLITELESKAIVQISKLFAISVLNVLWSIMANKRFSRNDAELQTLLDHITQRFRSTNILIDMLNLIPILKKLRPMFTAYKSPEENVKAVQHYMKETIKKHKQSLDENNPRDFIDVYLIEMQQQNGQKDSTFSEEGLIMTCFDLFSTGAESVSNFLGFCLMYMVLYPDVQQAVQAEIDSVVGRSRKPSLSDRQSLPYVEAVLTEVFRSNTIAPLTPPHRATKGTMFCGYTIPQDTMIFPCLWSLFQDREHWGNPEVFNPERFLSSEGKFINDEWMIPFGAGKRICMGETLARNTSFLFFTTLLQNFSFSVPAEDPKPSTVPLSGFTMAPQPFRVKVLQRI